MSDPAAGICSRIAVAMSITDEMCRECNRAVGPWETICPTCGIRNPVKIPRWIGTLILFLLVLPLFH